jgi:hypothetical protein
MTNFEKLLAELEADGTAEVRKSWAPAGADDAPTAADLRLAREVHRKSAASDLEQLQKNYWAGHARALARKAVNTFAPMLKALKAEVEQIAASPEFRKIDQANQFHAARGRLADFNKRFTAEVQAGLLSAEEAAKVEWHLNRHAAALDERGRNLGII